MVGNGLYFVQNNQNIHTMVVLFE